MINENSFDLVKKFIGRTVEVIVDRPKGAKHPRHDFSYEVNYGHIDGVTAPDGEWLDAYYLGADTPITRGTGECIAIIHRLSDDDDKLVVVPAGFAPTDQEIETLVHFQEKWFDHEIVRRPLNNEDQKWDRSNPAQKWARTVWKKGRSPRFSMPGWHNALPEFALCYFAFTVWAEPQRLPTTKYLKAAPMMGADLLAAVCMIMLLPPLVKRDHARLAGYFLFCLLCFWGLLANAGAITALVFFTILAVKLSRYYGSETPDTAEAVGREIIDITLLFCGFFAAAIAVAYYYPATGRNNHRLNERDLAAITFIHFWLRGLTVLGTALVNGQSNTRKTGEDAVTRSVTGQDRGT